MVLKISTILLASQEINDNYGVMRAAETDAEKHGVGSDGLCWQWGEVRREGVGESCPEEVKSEQNFQEVER